MLTYSERDENECRICFKIFLSASLEKEDRKERGTERGETNKVIEETDSQTGF